MNVTKLLIAATVVASALNTTHNYAHGDPGTFNASEKLCVEWNSYLGMLNVNEYANASSAQRTIDISLLDSLGIKQSVTNVAVAASAQSDVLVHELAGFVDNSYGLTCAAVTNGNSNDIDGRSVHYLPNGSEFDFAISLPYSGGIQGSQFVPFNTYDPSLNSTNFVANWISVTNTKLTPESGILFYYDFSGNLLDSESATLPAGGRRDFAAHQFGEKFVGLIEWRPDSATSHFIVRNVRYYYDNLQASPSFHSALQIEAMQGTGEELVVLLDKRNGTAVLELANVTGAPVTVAATFRLSNGTVAATPTFQLTAFASLHVIADQILTTELGSVTLDADTADSIVAAGLHYTRDSALRLRNAFALPGQVAQGSLLKGSYNTFLGQGCDLILVNETTSPVMSSITLTRNDGTTAANGLVVSTPPLGISNYDLCVNDSTESYGTVVVTPESTNALSGVVVRRGAEDRYQIATALHPGTRCDNFQALRQPFFGETHVHTSFSFDSYVFSNRNDPDAAYRFAKGESVPLPDVFATLGEPQTRSTQINRPLDFTAVTDHAELFGEMQVCTRSSSDTAGFDSISCKQMQTEKPNPLGSEVNPLTVAGIWSTPTLLGSDEANNLPFCKHAGVDCESAGVSIWQETQEAAEAHYDRSSDCRFTSFVAYEYTSQPEYDNLHRNVIFRNANVVQAPISNVDTNGPHISLLWNMLQEQCLDSDSGCDVLTIPHNANLSGSTDDDPAGRMFPDPQSPEEALSRRAFEPLVEIIQHKGGSECRFDRLTQQGVQTVDELCSFEQIPKAQLNPSADAVTIADFPTRNVLRNALKDGLALAPSYGGVNPFKFGFVGGTDSHNGTPGNTAENSWPGHAGTDDAPNAGLISGISRNAGGLAVVWAEENTRDSLFEAMRRRETYGTSGVRPIVRFFGGWNFDTDPGVLCSDSNLVSIGYDSGVPMGSDLPARSSDSNPRFIVSALKDAGSPSLAGTPLQRIQIIKGWVDAQGMTQEKVVEVVGEVTLSGDELDTDSCTVNQDSGAAELCAVWEDTDFDPALPSFYYARILENPTCRWSTFACRNAGVDPFASPTDCQTQAEAANDAAVLTGEIEAGDTPFINCCSNETNDPFIARTIQERAWTSPIWYQN